MLSLCLVVSPLQVSAAAGPDETLAVTADTAMDDLEQARDASGSKMTAAKPGSQHCHGSADSAPASSTAEAFMVNSCCCKDCDQNCDGGCSHHSSPYTISAVSAITIDFLRTYAADTTPAMPGIVPSPPLPPPLI